MMNYIRTIFMLAILTMVPSIILLMRNSTYEDVISYSQGVLDYGWSLRKNRITYADTEAIDDIDFSVYWANKTDTELEKDASFHLGIGFGDNPSLKLNAGQDWERDLSIETFLKMYRSYCYKHFRPEIVDPTMKLCPCVPMALEGNLTYILDPAQLDEVKLQFPEVTDGGHWSPSHCVARQKVAIIIPFRNRHAHLPIFLRHMIPILQKQMLEFRFIVVEQRNPQIFNKAKMMNVAFIQAKKMDVDCVVFHDIDILADDDRNFYTCFDEQPRHIAIYLRKLDYELIYPGFIGGSIGLTIEQFIRINGFPNSYFGWGGEDDDMFRRIVAAGYNILRFPRSITSYGNIPHERDALNPVNEFRDRGMKYRPEEYKADGLNNVQYTVVEVVEHALCTWFVVDIEEPIAFYSYNMLPNPFDGRKSPKYAEKLSQYLESHPLTKLQKELDEKRKALAHH